MGNDIFARTIRIDLEPPGTRREAPTVRFRPQGSAGSSHTTGSGGVAGAQCSEYERLLQCIYDAVLITDKDGIVLECNQRAIDFLLYPESQIVGDSVSRFVCGVDESVMSEIRRNLLDQRYTLIEGSCERRDGSLFPAEVAVNRLDMKPSGRLVFFIRNISVRKRAQDALEEAIEKVERHDRQRSQFISNVSHELRTPLTSIIYAITNVLRGVVGPVSDELKEYLNMLLGDCKRMLATVNDILDLRKIESNTLSLMKSRVPYGRLVRRSVESLQVQAQQKMIELEINTGNSLWFVDCDAQKIERVMINLVGNAIKFTPEGGKITVLVSDDPEHAGFVRVTVDDTGVGIPADSICHVTDRYYTVGDQPCGSGLGLSISKEIVSLHGGELTVESPVPGSDKGTRIAFRLPVAAPPSVLIVESDKVHLEELKRQINEHGYHVKGVVSGNEALASVAEKRPDVIVLDLSLPDIDGRDVIMRLKDHPDTVKIPILVMTGAHLSRSVSEVLRNFGIPVVAKPCTARELLDGIAKAFMRSLPFAVS